MSILQNRNQTEAAEQLNKFNVESRRLFIKIRGIISNEYLISRIVKDSKRKRRYYCEQATAGAYEK